MKTYECLECGWEGTETLISTEPGDEVGVCPECEGDVLVYDDEEE